MIYCPSSQIKIALFFHRQHEDHWPESTENRVWGHQRSRAPQCCFAFITGISFGDDETFPQGTEKQISLPLRGEATVASAAAPKTVIGAQSWGRRPEPDEVNSVEKGPHPRRRQEEALRSRECSAGRVLEFRDEQKRKEPSPSSFHRGGDEIKEVSLRDCARSQGPGRCGADTELFLSHPGSLKEGRIESALGRLTSE